MERRGLFRFIMPEEKFIPMQRSGIGNSGPGYKKRENRPLRYCFGRFYVHIKFTQDAFSDQKRQIASSQFTFFSHEKRSWDAS
ncbi:hypothetical protein SAMN05192553_105197 [Cyclobacterium xiamenense]|uniref:Uncharacterized protein n=1 Tax=Cyclobacterium xiamenense TaxID=1297121 RepID=A0A1H6ZWF9_9BACT|nr:hypothetical protein SAMN05192553_105197 [Cyclobacterium xiamenense]